MNSFKSLSTGVTKRTTSLAIHALDCHCYMRQGGVMHVSQASKKCNEAARGVGQAGRGSDGVFTPNNNLNV